MDAAVARLSPGALSAREWDGYLVPALGAFLGVALVQALGGRWLPRRDPRQARALLGGRVWLPHDRARRAPTSLTPLFAAAARAARGQPDSSA